MKNMTTFDSLINLKKGQKCRVVEIRNNNKLLEKRLIEMGITVGTKIFIKKEAPLGDPKCIFVRGYELCLRKEEMKQIFVEVLM